jgi:dTDP-4-amino-4,6-dideoxygalactose transaminase
MSDVSLPMSVPFFDYSRVFGDEEESFVSVFRNVGRRGAFILQRDLAEFEQELARAVGARYALGVGNATDALQLAVRAAGIGAGEEVIHSAHTMIATAAAIHFAGAIPVPVECGSAHLIDPQAVEAAVTARTRAIMPTQLNGRTCDMEALQAIADRHNLVIIEDAAQGLGSRFRGRCAGTFGVAGCISFYPAKVLGCFGDGGAVITSDDTMYERLCQLRDHGRNRDGKIVSWGLNSRLDNLQAAILAFQFKRYDRVVSRRRQMASVYTSRLGSVTQLVLPPGPDTDSDHFDVYQNYEIEAERRDDLKVCLDGHGIGTLIQWGGQPVHQCRELGFTQQLPHTDSLFTRLLMLPLNMSLTDDDIHYVCGQIRAFYRCPKD